MSDRFVRLPELRRSVPVSKSTLYLWISQGKFPAPHSLGGRAVAWLQSEVDAWMESRLSAPRP